MMKWLKKGLKVLLWLAVLFCIFGLPFVSKGFDLPDNWSGKSIGQALGENVRRWYEFWQEVRLGIVEGFRNP